MYEFVARYWIEEKVKEIKRKIVIDCTSLDRECMDNIPELLFAWKQAVTRAYELCGKEEIFISIKSLDY